MEEMNNDHPVERKGGCVQCNHPIVVPNVPTPLCEDCRNSFIKFPIPNWIKIFGGAVCLVVIFSMYKLPRNLMTGVHLEKGKTAISEKRYRTAQEQLEKFEQRVPDNIEANSYLLIAAYYNSDMATVTRLFNKLESQNFEDRALLEQVEIAVGNASTNFPGDSLRLLLEPYKYDISLLPEDSLRQFINKYPKDIYSLMYLASISNQKEDYKAADSILTTILSIDKDYFPALELLSAVKRQENELDESIECCNKLLEINHESTFGMASKSRTLLKQKKDTEALELAEKSYELGKADAYSTGSLLLAYHFTNKTKEKNELLQKVKANKDSVFINTMQFVTDVINGKKPFRN